MIRPLGEPDRRQVMELLLPDSTVNLFIIGDVENNGFATDFQQLWGDFDPRGSLRAILLRYFGSFVAYGRGDFDTDGLAEVFRSHRHLATAFSGLERVVSRFEDRPGLLPETAHRRTLFFLELRSGEKLAPLRRRPTLELVRAVPDDAPAIVELWKATGWGSEHGERALRHELEQGGSRVYLFREGLRVLATAKTTAENTRSPMVTGVTTHPDYRRRGMATQLLIRLCEELLHEGKVPCLLYDNPEQAPSTAALGSPTAGPGSCTSSGPSSGPEHQSLSR